MSSAGKQYAIAGLVLVVFLGAFLAWPYLHSKPPAVDQTKTAIVVTDFDDLTAKLAKKVYDDYGGGENGADFKVIVATPDATLGELLRTSGSLPADSDDCAPTPQPQAAAYNHLLPAYTSSSSTAIQANLGSNAVQALSSADLNLGSQSTVTYQIDNPQIELMADNNVEQVTSHGNCNAYLQGHPNLRLIRGRVTGKMTYLVKVSNPRSVSAALMKDFGKIHAEATDGQTIAITDTESQPIVALLSVMLTPPAVPAPVVAAPAPVAAGKTGATAIRSDARRSAVKVAMPPPAPPPLQPGQTHIFVQQDVADAADAGSTVAKQLAAALPGAMVERGIEKVPSAKMPTTAQVRFFNADDLATADQCLAMLQKRFPDARAVRSGLSAPKGQLEVWLPKAH